MNEVVLGKFTPQLLRGAERLGLNSGALMALLGLSETQLSRLACGLSALDVRQAGKLEQRTGRSVGELMAASLVLAIVGAAIPWVWAKPWVFSVLLAGMLAALSGAPRASTSGGSGPDLELRLRHALPPGEQPPGQSAACRNDNRRSQNAAGS